MKNFVGLSLVAALLAGAAAARETDAPAPRPPDAGRFIAATKEEIQAACKRLGKVTCVWLTVDKNDTPLAPSFPDWWETLQQARKEMAASPQGSEARNASERRFLKAAEFHTFAVLNLGDRPITHYPHVAFFLIVPIHRKGMTFYTGGPWFIDTATLGLDDQHAGDVWEVVENSSLRLLDKQSPEVADYMNGRFAAYRAAFKVPDIQALRAAIRQYQDEDPENLIPEAQKRVAIMESAEQAAQAAEAHAKRLADLEASIKGCRAQIANANAAIAREKRVAAVSGYENSAGLHQAGQMIVYCEDAIPAAYAEYRKSGGTKPLASIR